MKLTKSVMVFLIAMASLSAFATGGGDSLCKAEERVVFSCTVLGSGKMVSLCGSKLLTRDEGYIQYRFGRPGKIALEFPTGTKGTQKKFRYAHYSRFQVDRTEVTFDVNKHSYTLFDSSEGDEKMVEHVRGISVALPTKGKRELQCSSDVMGGLTELEPIAACDKDNPLNMAGCPAN